MDCPDDNQLAAFLEGALPDDEHDALRAHLATCDECRTLVAAEMRHAHELRPGARVGRYVVERRVGAGAMGVVYAAHDPELNRRVAIKVLHTAAGAQLDALRVRMQREAQAMARLHHPHVITIFDVGQVEAQIFIAMEFVEGETLRAWLHRKRRTYAEIARAFLAAGRGLLAAHRAGMVHRDFKPDNVLVAHDGSVKVTDFGLARALDDERTEPQRSVGAADSPSPLQLTLTRTGMAVGTPVYMAPEQLDGAVASAASDQYSFCAAFWEALYGARPFDGESLGALHAAIRGGVKLPSSARLVVPRHVSRALERGLSFEPSARFPSLDALLGVIDSDPARRRRRWAVGALTASAVVASLVFAVSSRRTSCVDGAAKTRDAFGAAARERIEKALLASGQPYAATTVSGLFALLDARSRQIEAAYDQTCVAVRRGEQSTALVDLQLSCLDRRVRETTALVNALDQSSATLLDRAVDAASSLTPIDRCAPQLLIGRAAPPSDPSSRAQLATLGATLAESRVDAELGRIPAARDRLRAAVATATELGYAPMLAELELALGGFEDATDDTKAATRSLVAALRAAEAGRADDLATAALIELTRVDGYRRSQTEVGLAWAEVARGVMARLGGDERLQASLDHAVGVVLQSAGRYDEARQRLESALAVRRRLLGASHPAVAETLTQLGFVLRDLARFDEGRVVLEEALVLREALYGAQHPSLAMTLNQLGGVYRRLGDFDRSLQMHQRALVIVEARLGRDHIEAGYAHNHLGNVYAFRGEWDAALRSFREALRIGQKALEGNHWELGMAHNNIAWALRWLGRFEEAESELQLAAAQVAPTLGKEHRFYAEIQTNFGDVYRLLGRNDEAKRTLATSLALLEKTVGASHPELADSLTALGWAELVGNDLPQAERHLSRAHQLRSAVAHPRADIANTSLGFAIARARVQPSDEHRDAVIAARDALFRFQLSARERAWIDAMVKATRR